MVPSFDIIFVLPYPFSDHPSFPEGILRKALEVEGYSVGIIETPFWQDSESFAALGKPRRFFAVISGPVDSVVLNYTSSRKTAEGGSLPDRRKGVLRGVPSFHQIQNQAGSNHHCLHEQTQRALS